MYVVKLAFSRFDGKTWLASLEGKDPRFSVKRLYMRGDQRLNPPSINAGVITYRIPTGLYEACEGDNRRYFVVYRNESTGQLDAATLTLDQTTRIMTLMAGGMSLDAARHQAEIV